MRSRESNPSRQIVAPPQYSMPSFFDSPNAKLLIGGGIAILLALYVRQSLTHRVDLTDRTAIVAASDDFFETEVAHEPGLVLVKFGAEWCPPCKMMDRELNSYKITADAIKVVLVDVDHQTALASHYKVGAIPHTFLFQEGKVVGDEKGALTANEISEWIAKTKSSLAMK